MASTNCIYKSVTLTAGETFVLPPGAELISASDSNAITNSCGTEIPNVPIKCWRIAYVLNEDPEGEKTVNAFVYPAGSILPPRPGIAIVDIPSTGNAWEQGDGDGTDWINVHTFSIGGNITTADIKCNDFTALEAAFQTSSAGALLTDRKWNSWFKEQSLSGLESPQWGSFWKSGYHIISLHFKATEEIAKSVYLEFQSSVSPSTESNVGSIPRFFAEEINCDDYPSTTLVTSC